MKTKILLLAAIFALALSSCDDFLDRQDLEKANDDTYWTSEVKVRLYANEYYGYFFTGYGVKNNTQYAALLGYAFSDDMVVFGNQTEFERSVPNTKGDDKPLEAAFKWQTLYSGPTWSFAWIRKSNLMINRIETRMQTILTNTEKGHWIGIARFFRGMEYARMVNVFGDVPYYDTVLEETDFDALYKPRNSRNDVMDKVYDDFKYALANVKLDDGDQYVNRYVVAAYIARMANIEGSWQKYHYNNVALATKFFELAVEAGDFVKASNKFAIELDFRSLFGSVDLKGKKDCIFYRHYDIGVNVSHAVASNCNLSESRNMGPSLALIKSFICIDGKDWETSGVANAKNFSLEEMVKTRDPRFEASFWDKPSLKAKGSYLAITKFIDRNGPTHAAAEKVVPTQYTSTNNVNDYPIMRYAELLLNWIEAKAELADLGTGAAVTQADIDESINLIRDRPLDDIAKAKDVQQTAHLSLAALPNDVERDLDVSTLLWEVRRERRMELAFEFSRIVDLRRWKKLEYMDATINPDILRGTWVNFPVELPKQFDPANKGSNIGIMAVTDQHGDLKVYDGDNEAEMVGFYSPTLNKARQPFLSQPSMNPYLSPVGTNERVDYRSKGYSLAQTPGWSDVLPQ